MSNTDTTKNTVVNTGGREYHTTLKGVRVMVLNATFNNISILSLRKVLLVEETGEPGENHRPVASHWQTLWHNVVSSTPRLSGILTHNFSGDITDYIGNCKFNYHTSTTKKVCCLCLNHVSCEPNVDGFSEFFIIDWLPLRCSLMSM